MFTVAVRLFSRETRKMYGHFFCIKLSSVNFSAPRKFGVNYNRTHRTLYIIEYDLQKEIASQTLREASTKRIVQKNLNQKFHNKL